MARPRNKLLKAYFIKSHKDEDCGLAIVAYTLKEARRLMRKSGEFLGDSDFIDMVGHWLRNANVEGLKEGDIIYSGLEGCKRYMYSWTEDECPCCGEYSTIQNLGGGVVGCGPCTEPECYPKHSLKRANRIPFSNETKEGSNEFQSYLICTQCYVCLDKEGVRLFGCDLGPEDPERLPMEKCLSGGTGCKRLLPMIIDTHYFTEKEWKMFVRYSAAVVEKKLRIR